TRSLTAPSVSSGTLAVSEAAASTSWSHSHSARGRAHMSRGLPSSVSGTCRFVEALSSPSNLAWFGQFVHKSLLRLVIAVYGPVPRAVVADRLSTCSAVISPLFVTAREFCQRIG